MFLSDFSCRFFASILDFGFQRTDRTSTVFFTDRSWFSFGQIGFNWFFHGQVLVSFGLDLVGFFLSDRTGFLSDRLDSIWFFHGQCWFSFGLDFFGFFRSDWTGFSSDGFGFLLRIVSSRFFG